MLNHKLNKNLDNNLTKNTKLSILYKEPIILYNNNTNIYDIILFIYKPYINKNSLYKNINSKNLLITKLINNILSNSQLNNNFNLNIKPIILTYDYLDSTIYSKSLSKHLSKYPKLDTIKNVKINQKILNNILINKINKNNIIENINLLINSKINLNKENNIHLLNNQYISKNIMIYSNLLHQYIIGDI